MIHRRPMPAAGTAGAEAVARYHDVMADGGPRLSHLPIYKHLSTVVQEKLDRLPPPERERLFRAWASSCADPLNPVGEDVFETCRVCGAEDWRDEGGRMHKLQHDPIRHYTAETGRTPGQITAKLRTAGERPEGPVVVREHFSRRRGDDA